MSDIVGTNIVHIIPNYNIVINVTCIIEKLFYMEYSGVLLDAAESKVWGVLPPPPPPPPPPLFLLR